MRTGWVGQAHTDLFVSSTILFMSYHCSPSKPQSLELSLNAKRVHTRVRERVRGVLVRITAQSERTEESKATTRSACALSHQNRADFVRNTFELRPIHTSLSKRI